MPTIRDVADRADVSTSTVSHVINDTRHVKPETRERVLQAMEELHYQPNRLAQSLRNRRTFTLGVLLPNSANPFFAQVLLGVEEACFDHGYNVILGNANDDPQRELAYLEVLLSKQVDGILLVSTGGYDAVLDALSSRETPVVMVDRAPGENYADLHIDTVFTDNVQGGILATEFLLGLGHRRIGCVSGPTQLKSSADRVIGYRKALDGAGITVDPSMIVSAPFQHEGGYRACKELLAAEIPPTAMFVCNDMMAVGALSAIHEAGLRVPDDISVVGYDDIPLAKYVIPRLTTIAQPSQELGRLAVEMLIGQLDHSGRDAQHRLLPVQLVERDSCGPASGR